MLQGLKNKHRPHHADRPKTASNAAPGPCVALYWHTGRERQAVRLRKFRNLGGLWNPPPRSPEFTEDVSSPGERQGVEARGLSGMARSPPDHRHAG